MTRWSWSSDLRQSGGRDTAGAYSALKAGDDEDGDEDERDSVVQTGSEVCV